MSCTNCLDNQFFTELSQHYLTDHGIPVNVSKPILKILYHSLDECGLNCCNNTVEVDSVVQYQEDGENLGTAGTATVINFGAGVTAVRDGDTITITVGGGEGGVAPGVYGDIEVLGGGIWRVRTDSVELIDLKDIPRLTVLGNPLNTDGPVVPINVHGGHGIEMLQIGLDYYLRSDIYGNNIGTNGYGVHVPASSTTSVLAFRKLEAGSGITISQQPAGSLLISGSALPLANNDYGDITVSGTGNIWTIDNDAVTYAKIQNVSAASKLLGRGDSGAGDVQEITLGTGLSMSGTTLNATGGGGGSDSWLKLGNSGTNSGINFIGTTDDVDVVFKRYNTIAGRLGYDNTSFGKFALYQNTTGINNTANGIFALTSNTTGENNTANGSGALYSNTTGQNNTAVGNSALFSNTTGANNTANGNQALYNNTIGNYNIANGVNALYSNTTGNFNTANGVNALHENTTGDNNTANGLNALFYNTTGESNTANGAYALNSNTTGSYNTANGNNALYSNTTGEQNTANGTGALYSNTTGYNNTAIGNNTLYYNTTGNQNVSVGGLSNNTTGLYNTSLGLNSLINNATGSYNTAIGAVANVSTPDQTYSTAIGSGAIVSTDNTVKLGRSAEDSVVIGQDGAVASAKLAVTSTTQGILFPRMTTIQKNTISAPDDGLVVYDTTLNKLCVRANGAWETITSVP